MTKVIGRIVCLGPFPENAEEPQHDNIFKLSIDTFSVPMRAVAFENVPRIKD